MNMDFNMHSQGGDYMQQYPKQLMVKYPLNKFQVAGWLILALFMLATILVAPAKSTLSWGISIFAVTLSTTVVIVTLWWGLRKPHTATFKKDEIMLGNTVIESHRIDKIMINGKVVGIQLKNKNYVSPKLCISFLDGPDGLQVLRVWAKHHHVRVVREPFMRWF